jgi:hypothetical protein
MALIAGGVGGPYIVTAPANAELYDPAAGAFVNTGSLNTVRDTHTATLLNNGTVLIAGGEQYGVIALASVEVYDPAARTFTATTSLTTPRYGPAATRLNSGAVLFAGGIDLNGNLLTSAELFQPNSLTPPGLVSITISPQNASVGLGGAQQFVATGTFTDNSTETLESVTWSSSATSVATVSNDASNYGNAVGVS